MAPRLPQFKTGITHGQLSASEMQNMSDEVGRFSNLVGGAGIQVRKNATGVLISATRAGTAPNMESLRWAAVVAEPKSGDDTLTVRELALKEEGVPFSYRWASENRIDAVPGIGYAVEDFVGNVFGDVEVNDDGVVIEPVRHVEPDVNIPIVLLQFRQASPPRVSLWPMTAQLKIVTIFGGYLDCVYWNGRTAGSSVLVARPYGLRAWSRQYIANGIVYRPDEDAQRREARAGLQLEDQVVNPRYRVSDLIKGTTGIRGGVDTSAPAGLPEEVPDGVAWLDDNVSGRWWALAS